MATSIAPTGGDATTLPSTISEKIVGGFMAVFEPAGNLVNVSQLRYAMAEGFAGGVVLGSKLARANVKAGRKPYLGIVG